MAYLVPSTPPMRGRAYSYSQPSQYYPPTPYSGNNLSIPYSPGVSRSAGAYYVAPTVVSGGRRSRSHSRPRYGHSHHRSNHHHSGHHGHSRRSHSVGANRLHHNRPSVHYASQRPHTGVASSRHYHSQSLGSRILGFFGLGSSHRYVDQYGRSVDSRGRPRHKY